MPTLARARGGRALALTALAVLVVLTTAGAFKRYPAEPERPLKRDSAQGQGREQVPTTGVLEGYVRLAGESRPTSTRVRNTTDPEACGVEHDLEDLLVSAENRGIRDVIATLVDVPGDLVSATPPGRLVIDNRECRFTPHVAVGRVGDTIVATNSDAVSHNTHYYGPLRSNVALPVQGMSVSRVFQRAGMITVLCDVHGWMRAIVRVDEHPFHAVSDDLGFFRVAGIPTGTHTLELWHETLGTSEVRVEIQATQTTRLEFELAATAPRR